MTPLNIPGEPKDAQGDIFGWEICRTIQKFWIVFANLLFDFKLQICALRSTYIGLMSLGGM